MDWEKRFNFKISRTFFQNTKIKIKIKKKDTKILFFEESEFFPPPPLKSKDWEFPSTSNKRTR